MRQFCRELDLKKEEFLIFMGCVVLAFAAGMGVLALIMDQTGGEENWICLGTVMAGGVYVTLSLFLRTVYYAGQIRSGLTMGRTRKELMVQTFLRYFLENTLIYLLILGGYALESAIYPDLYAGHGIEMLPALTSWRGILSAELILPVLPMLMGTLYLHFGKIAGWVTYFVWMFILLFLPKLINASPLNTGFLDQAAYQMVVIFEGLPGEVPLVLAIAAAAAMGGATWRLGKTAAVQS